MSAWIIGFIERTGYWGIALLMFAENAFPPIPSELIMPFAGFAAARGHFHPVLVVLAGVAGSLAGASLWYVAGRAFGLERVKRLADRHGHWLTVTGQDLDRAEAWFARRGRLAVFLGRLVPAVRTLISVPAGVLRMPPLTFMAWSGAGTLAWTTVLMLSGYLLEQAYERMVAWVDVATWAIVAAIAVAYVGRVVRGPRSSG